jgi:phosphoribosylformimino-5-aminoimidazole carboxamide ribotide isomerase
MLIIPAIDLKGGKCVRLSQGKMNESTTYSDNPSEIAVKWEKMGAKRLHIVDLDGAVSGIPKNMELINKIRNSVNMEIELGGGIRDLKTIEAYFSAGIDFIILGTAAIKDPKLLRESCNRYPGKIIIGIDAREGIVSVQGWTEATKTTAVDFAKKLDSTKVAAIVFTDISRDGMLTGPNIEGTAELAKAIAIPIIASGGISGIKDIKDLLEIEQFGVFATIIGRALYTGNIDLKECIKTAR